LFSDVPMPVDVINVKSTDNSDIHKKLVKIVIYQLNYMYCVLFYDHEYKYGHIKLLKTNTTGM